MKVLDFTHANAKASQEATDSFQADKQQLLEAASDLDAIMIMGYTPEGAFSCSTAGCTEPMLTHLHFCLGSLLHEILLTDDTE